MREIPVSQIRPGENDRQVFEPAGLRALADSIRDNGLGTAISVRPAGPDGFVIIAGERRWRAHQLLGRDTIRAEVKDVSEEQASREMLMENLHRADLNPIEEARGYQSRMAKFGIGEAEVARWANQPLSRIRARLELLTLRDDVQHLLASGQMGIGHARAMVGLDFNRQGIAMRALTETDQLPTIAKMRDLCARLLSQQVQDPLFSDDGLLVLQTWQEAQPLPFETDIPVNPTLPPMRGGMTVAKAVAQYIEDLQGAGLEDAAATVGTVLLGLQRSNLCSRRESADPSARM